MSENKQILPDVNPNDTISRGLNLLSFFVPIIGGLLYLANKSEHPIKAKAIGRAALSGVFFSAFLQILRLLASDY
jgi:hypothetical protein